MPPRREVPLIDVTDLIETWMLRREGLAKSFSQDSLRGFVEVMNGITRQVMAKVDMNEPDFWSAWIEIGQQASTFSVGAKTIANKIDRSNL